MTDDEYGDIYRISEEDLLANSVYDEDGDHAYCDLCGDYLWYDRKEGTYHCRSCGREMDRAEFFDYIGAEPPKADCLSECRENYPGCKQFCFFI